LDLIFPPRCAACGRVDTIWCDTCQQDIDQLPFPPVSSLSAEFALRAITSTGLHSGKLRLAVHSLKFDAMPDLAQPLGDRLYRRLEALPWTIDMLVPVPLHPQRLHERGYNQAQLLCETLAMQSGLPMITAALTRQLATRPQVGLNAEQRHDNMRDAFAAVGELVAGRTVLLIDDVFTTGATLDSCAQALLHAGASAVYGLTVTSV
jgi:ComF family protein